MTRLMVALIRGYQHYFSFLKPPVCRFYPSCSEYAAQALLTWGLARGGWLALRRLLRCHPLHPGGEDLVPARPEKATAEASR
jgi:hypothetical protein